MSRSSRTREHVRRPFEKSRAGNGRPTHQITGSLIAIVSENLSFGRREMNGEKHDRGFWLPGP
jgi:hypothetical protein